MEREHRKPLKYYLPSVKNKQMRCLNGANRRLMGDCKILFYTFHNLFTQTKKQALTNIL